MVGLLPSPTFAACDPLTGLVYVINGVGDGRATQHMVLAAASGRMPPVVQVEPETGEVIALPLRLQGEAGALFVAPRGVLRNRVSASTWQPKEPLTW